MFYAGCPVCWASKLQSQVALSTTEAEYIAMSQALRNVIPVMNLIQEMREKGFQVICTLPSVYCKVFEDNSGALELARLPKLRPRTKHINVCYHHFREPFLLAQKTRLLMHLLRHWHKMTSHVIAATDVASNTSEPPM